MIGQILLWCVLVPLCICVPAYTLAARVCSSKPPTRLTQYYATGIVIGGWSLSVAISLWGRQGFNWWPVEAWHSPLVSCAVTGLVMGLCQAGSDRSRYLQWWILGLALAWVSFIAMPTGETWQDVLPLHRKWIFLITMSGLSNIFWLQRLSENSAKRWVSLVALAGLAGPAILAGTVYAGLAEWFVSACVATAIAALLAIFWPEARLWTVVYPASLFAVVGTASSRFYNYEEVSSWIYLLILFTPSIVAILDLPVRRQSSWKRAILASVITGHLLASIAWGVVSSSQSEW